MIKRTLAASAAVLVVGVASTPVPAGGFVSGHWAFNRGGFQGVRTQPLVRPGQMPPFTANPVPVTVNRMSGVEFAHRHRHGFGFDGPVAGWVYGPTNEPVYVGTIDRPLPPPVFEDNAPRNGGAANVCQTETRTVPSEAGGEHAIHITRCWN
jgi:hypothetical protein